MPALGRPRGSVAHPAARRLAHRPDERAGSRGFDRPRGRQAGRRARRRLPRDATWLASATDPSRVRRRASPRCSATASKPGPRTGPTRILEHFADAARLRPAPSAARAGRLPRRRCAARQIASSSTTGGRSPSCWHEEYYGTLARRGTPSRDDVLRRGARRREAAARRRPGDARSQPTFRWARCGRSIPAVGPRPTYVADLKGAASVAHVYGKAWTGSEAFTSFGDPWIWSPQSPQAHRRPPALPGGDAVLHPHLRRTSRSPRRRRASRSRRSSGQAFTVQRDLGGHGAAVDRLPRPMQRAAERGSARSRFRGLRRRRGARDRAVRWRLR